MTNVPIMQYGEDAIKEGMGGGGGGGMSDIFDLFGGGGRSRQQRGPQRGESVSHRLKVSLEDMYKGTTRSGMDKRHPHMEQILKHVDIIVQNSQSRSLSHISSLG